MARDRISPARRIRPLCLLATLLLAACFTPPRKPAPPVAISRLAPSGFPSTVRFLGVDRDFFLAHAEDVERGLSAAAGGGPLNILALSGGGAGGAFGAGALVGLSRLGDRPRFHVVTGVSAGALLAPFAFLGPEWDNELIEAFDTDRAAHLMRPRGLSFLFRPGVYRREPLVELVDHFVTELRRGRSALAQSRAGRGRGSADRDVTPEGEQPVPACGGSGSSALAAAQAASEILAPRPHVQLERPGAARLMVQVPVGLGDRVGIE